MPEDTQPQNTEISVPLMLLHDNVQDERTVQQWLLTGMHGRLVRTGDGPITVQPCAAEEDGQYRLFIAI